MSRESEARNKKAIHQFRKQGVLMIEEVAGLLSCSIPTARRRLKQWQALTSYNRNGRYYTLPDVPRFDANGLWQQRGICFSQYGTLKRTVVELVHRSPAGLGARDMRSLLGVDPRSFLSAFAKHPQLTREKVHGRFVYYSAEETLGKKQREQRRRMSENARLPVAFEAIAILVEKIKHPDLSNEELSRRLEKQEISVAPEGIENFFAKQGLSVKKTLHSA